MPFFTDSQPQFASDRFSVSVSVSGHRAVLIDGNRNPQYASADNAAHASKRIGVTLGAAAPGDAVEVAWSGLVTEPSWSWVPDLPVFVGINGALTQTQPTKPGSLFRKSLGVALSATSLMLDPDVSVLL